MGEQEQTVRLLGVVRGVHGGQIVEEEGQRRHRYRDADDDRATPADVAGADLPDQQPQEMQADGDDDRIAQPAEHRAQGRALAALAQPFLGELDIASQRHRLVAGDDDDAAEVRFVEVAPVAGARLELEAMVAARHQLLRRCLLELERIRVEAVMPQVLYG